MAFKMKGPSTHKGTLRHKLELSMAKPAPLKVDHDLDVSLRQKRLAEKEEKQKRERARLGEKEFDRAEKRKKKIEGIKDGRRT